MCGFILGACINRYAGYRISNDEGFGYRGGCVRGEGYNPGVGPRFGLIDGRPAYEGNLHYGCDNQG